MLVFVAFSVLLHAADCGNSESLKWIVLHVFVSVAV